LQARGLQGNIMITPAWDVDPAKRAERWRAQAAFIGEVAKRHAGVLRWYELGNEPDLTFFTLARPTLTSRATSPCARRSKPTIPPAW